MKSLFALFLTFLSLVASAALNAPAGQNTVLSMKAGDSVVVVPVGIKPADCIDYGLYGKADTLSAPAGVNIVASDYTVKGVFTFGPQAVAHLYSCSRTATITANGAVGAFFVVPKGVPSWIIPRYKQSKTL
jgi:hypothetical protein